MKQFKTLVLGFIAGAACMVSTTAFASAFGINVSAYLPGNITFKINGANVAADSDMPVLNYNDRVYVPIRFVAEQLGCTVNYDYVLNQVVLESPEPEVVEVIKEVEVPVYVADSDTVTDAKVYQTFPIKLRDTDFLFELTGFDPKYNSTNSKFFVNFENKSSSKLMLVQNKCKLEVDGKEYTYAEDSNKWDSQWFSDINPDDEVEGGLYFQKVPEDYEKGTLTIVIRDNTRPDKDEITYEINFRATEKRTIHEEDD